MVKSSAGNALLKRKNYHARQSYAENANVSLLSVRIFSEDGNAS
ncbi:hypothetical protein VII00023_21879 [Vibrio ichthyoenteri ATCC 700023]|uniref:Uncharacterized protein n=1 Tax=Vibrio ichthyoenteri ATCC 700023 TaxID=870968 RepID=F9S6G0_9VIBR|nr:hypothetical protein VII00023_21879 [Vibrio ichthyoenteri ATCC 700023]